MGLSNIRHNTAEVIQDREQMRTLRSNTINSRDNYSDDYDTARTGLTRLLALNNTIHSPIVSAAVSDISGVLIPSKESGYSDPINDLNHIVG